MSGTLSHFVLATAGHVDHGKSSLVKALTGIDPDRLPEEKARGITIDLGFAQLTLPGRGHLRSSVQLGIVDVPGHEDFVKNMVAGVGSIDLALLVVAVDDGWMPQTEEHLQILSYLGVTRAVVALTKTDLSQTAEEAVIGSVSNHLVGTRFADAPIVPTSVLSGRGLDELKEALARVLADAPLPRDIGKPRLPIDRVFTLHGIGTVVTGTLAGGSFQHGQPVILQPSGKRTRIRSIQSHNQELNSIGPGTRTALGLADVAVGEKGSSDNSAGVRRGHVVTLSDLGAATETFDVLLERSARPCDAKKVPRGLKDGLRVRVHHGTGNTSARLLLLEQKVVAPGERAIAQLRFDSPVFAFVGDHFIVRDWAEQATLAGGTVLDTEADRTAFRSPTQASLLHQRAESPANAVTALQSQLERDRIVRQPTLLSKANFSSSEISSALTQLRAEGKVWAAGDLIADAAWWNTLRATAAQLVDAHHQAHPEQRGLTLSQLRSALESQLPWPDIFEVLTTDLCRTGFVLSGTDIHRAAHRPALPPHLQTAGARLRALLSAKPFEPPSRKELAPSPAAQQALRFLIQTEEAVELGPDVVLLADSFARATDLVRKHLRERRSATVSELRQVIGASRRIVVPLLEKLDRDRVTKREGDVRVLLQH